jgi:hypothetical protein
MGKKNSLDVKRKRKELKEKKIKQQLQQQKKQVAKKNEHIFSLANAHTQSVNQITGGKVVSHDKCLWKQTTKIKTGIFGTKEITFFNFFYWVSSQDTRSHKNTISYAQVECFVDMVSELRYDKLERWNDYKTKDDEQLKKQSMLKSYTVESLVSIVGITVSMTGDYGQSSNAFVDYFMSMKDRIKCKKLKFALLTRIYQVDSRFVDFEELKELRSGFSFEEMIQICNRNNNFFSKKEYLKYLDKWTRDITKLQDEQGFLTVYRSFRINRGEKIRQGLKRECQSLEHGKGNSFTFKKVIALKVSAYINTYMIKRYLGFKGRNNEDKLAKDVLTGSFMNKGVINAFDDDDRSKDTFGVIAEFKIKKDDIVVFSESLSESEVIMDYKKAKLIDYTFMNIIHFFATSIAYSLYDNTKMSGLEGTQHNANLYMNADRIFDIVYWHTSQHFKNNKSELRNAVRNGQVSREALIKIIGRIDEKKSDDEMGIIHVNWKEKGLVNKNSFGIKDSEIFQSVGFTLDDTIVGLINTDSEYWNCASTTGLRQTKKKSEFWELQYVDAYDYKNRVKIK